jgi:hypothetical protein
MRIVAAVEAELRRTIRDARAKDPLISVAHIKAALEAKFNKGFSYQYVAKLVEKVGREAAMQASRTKIEQRINLTRETYRLSRERLLQIVYWQYDPDLPAEVQRQPYAEDVIEACKNLVMLDIALLKAEIDCGMYRDEQEAAAALHYAPMPAERRVIVINAFIAWGLLPKEQVEQIVPALPALHGATDTAEPKAA